MQVGNLYINMSINGLEKENVMDSLSLVSLKIVESAGASLPYLYISLLTRDDRVKNFIQRNNSIKITLGNTPKNADTFNTTIYAKKAAQNSSGYWAIEFTGFILNSAYMIDQINKTYKGNSLMVVNDVMKEYFGGSSFVSKKGGLDEKGKTFFDGDPVDDMSDRLKEEVKEKKRKFYMSSDFVRVKEKQMVWRRNNQTACTFVADTLLHCDVSPSFPLFSFDKYGNFYVKDLKRMIEKGPVHNFVARPIKNFSEIQFINDFDVDDFRDMYNMYSGFDKITEVQGIDAGAMSSVISRNQPVLASTQIAEKSEIGSTTQTNNLQSSNVHKTYYESFINNTNSLMSLSSMLGTLQLSGTYYKALKPLDLVSVETPEDGKKDATNGGLYLIDTIITEADFASGGIRTYVLVTRDNKNNVENYVEKKKKKSLLKLAKKFVNKIAQTVHRLSTAYSLCLQIIDGTYLNKVLTFMVATKTNLLRSFTIAGVTQDLTGQIGILKSLILSGNSLMNSLLDMVLPEGIATTLHDFIIRKPSLIGLISSYVAEFVPYKARFPIMLLAEAIFDTTDTLNSIAKDNGISLDENIEKEEEVEELEKDFIEESDDRVSNIIEDFENNTSGLDIPFPIINLTESQMLFPEESLRNYVATETLDNLTDLNYLNGVDRDKFKRILLGEEPIDFSIIDQINKNTSSAMSYRLWGTYNSLIELTDFYIKKSYKDKFKTLPCTKLISATKNAKIFFACPKKEEDLRFYINSNRVILKSFDIDLGYTDPYKVPLKYTVYYTEEGYNSNSVLFEVKQGGMV